MNPILAALLKQLRDNPAGAASSLSAILNIVEVMPTVFVAMIPDGPVKPIIEHNPAAAIEFLRGLVALIGTIPPELIVALVAQFGKR